MTDLSVVAANLHNDRSGVAAVRGEHADVALLSEAQHRRRQLARIRGHRYHTGPRGHDGAARETGILVADRLPDLGGGSYFLTAAYDPAPRVGKERWGQVAVTEVEGATIAAITAHPVAAPTALRLDRAGELPSRHDDAVAWLDATIRAHRDLGHQVVVGGDMNLRQSWEAADTLKRVIRRLDLDGLWVGLDLLMVTPGLRVVDRYVDHDALPDHPLLRLDLNIRHH